MEENVLGTEERTFTIEDLQRREAELKMLEEKEITVTAELEKIIDRDENEIGE